MWQVGVSEALARRRRRYRVDAVRPRDRLRERSVRSGAGEVELRTRAPDFEPPVGAEVGRDVAFEDHRRVGWTQPRTGTVEHFDLVLHSGADLIKRFRSRFYSTLNF